MKLSVGIEISSLLKSQFTSILFSMNPYQYTKERTLESLSSFHSFFPI